MSYYDDIYTLVSRIPYGLVSTYGRIAMLCGTPRGARGVGWALHALSGEQAHQVPWWRVVNVAGRISNEYHAELQRALLEAEGVVFNTQGRIDLRRYLWEPPSHPHRA
ncbi:MAG TPA: MGMT family protein [Roseiflexaceae bacterium]|nr:MGMT family protein [Roseiflexaceae bacterium]HMP42298.1 MGMT family protein [Roseiflexaceae bacterium]